MLFITRREWRGVPSCIRTRQTVDVNKLFVQISCLSWNVTRVCGNRVTPIHVIRIVVYCCMLCRPGLIILAHKPFATKQLANYRKAFTRFFDAQLVHVLFNYPTIISEALQSRTGSDQYQCKLLSLKATFTWSRSFPSGYSETSLSSSAKLMFINRGVRYCFLNSCRMKQDLWFRPSVDAIDSLSMKGVIVFLNV